MRVNTKFDTLGKSPDAALRSDASGSLRRTASTPHSFGCARLACILQAHPDNELLWTFYDSIKFAIACRNYTDAR